jgi:uncharacterized protein with PQ loop repeat
MSAILGVLAMLVSLSVVFFGLTTQAWKNYQRKTCEGLSLTLMLVTLLASTTWGAYGISKPDWFLASSQMPGAILSLIIVGQCLFYDYLPARRREKREMWEAELKWVQGQIDVITLERANMREGLTKTATDPHLVSDEGRDERQRARSDELRENGILLGDMLKKRKALQQKLGLVTL